MKNVVSVFLLVVMSFLSGCSSLRSGFSSAYNLANCNYRYNSISNLSVSGISLSNGLSALIVPKIVSILGGKASSIPLNFTLNLNVENPNNGTAAFQSLSYIISVDDVQFTTGNFDKPFSVGGGETKILPMKIAVNISELMKNNSKSTIENIVKNFIGVGDKQSKVVVQLKPSFMIGEQIFKSPMYIPVSFDFGGKAQR